MKTIRALLVSLACLVFAGCASFPIGAASTRIEIKTPDRSASIVLPKNLRAVDPKLTFDPATGAFTFAAKSLSSDASTVIDSAAVAQAQAIGELSQTVRTLLPLALPLKP